MDSNKISNKPCFLIKLLSCESVVRSDVKSPPCVLDSFELLHEKEKGLEKLELFFQ